MATWYSGHNDYQKITFDINEETKEHLFHLELLDVPTSNADSITDIFNIHLAEAKGRVVEVLYSGGSDSEIILIHCVRNNIPVRAITMRLLVNGCAINTHDLYYSEKFCRENNVEHVIIDLHADKFFTNGDHISYLEQYKLATPHVATHFWLFEQCSSFPIIGGDYTWPWHDKLILSPQRHPFACYSKFLADNSIDGIGGMLNYSLESNMKFVKKHLEVYDKKIHDGKSLKIPKLKQDLFEALGFGKVERRLRSYGWEGLNPEVFNINFYKEDLINRFGTTVSRITWNEKMAMALGSTPGTNDKN